MSALAFTIGLLGLAAAAPAPVRAVPVAPPACACYCARLSATEAARDAEIAALAVVLAWRDTVVALPGFGVPIEARIYTFGLESGWRRGAERVVEVLDPYAGTDCGMLWLADFAPGSDRVLVFAYREHGRLVARPCRPSGPLGSSRLAVVELGPLRFTTPFGHAAR